MSLPIYIDSQGFHIMH